MSRGGQAKSPSTNSPFVHFMKEVSRLTQDTVVKVLSFDFSPAVLVDEQGKLYTLQWVEEENCYYLRNAEGQNV